MKTIEQQAEEYAKQQKIKRTQGQSVAVCIKNEDLQFDAFIAGYEAAKKWISVEEELPQNITTVLVCGNSMRTTALFQDGFFYPDFEVVGNIVTHWLPIPKLPTK